MPTQKNTAGLGAPRADESPRTGSGRTGTADSLPGEGSRAADISAGAAGASAGEAGALSGKADTLAGAADSTALGPAADSLRTDSLWAAAGSFGANGRGAKEIWDAWAVYGPGSRTVRMVQDTPVRIPVNPVSGDIGLQIIVLTAAAAWCLLAYRFREQVKIFVGGFFGFRSEEKFWAEYGQLFDKMIGYAIPLCAAAVGIFATKAAAAIRPELFSEMPSWAAAASVLVAGGAFLLIFALQCAVIGMAGGLTLSKEFARAIVFNKKLALAVTAVVTLPLVALYTGLDSTADIVMGYVVAGVIVMLALVFVLRTMMLFIRQKVSLLVWILYLCAIEIFPAGVLTLLAVKYI